MQHIDRFRKPCHVNEALGVAFLLNSDLVDAGSQSRHRLPIIGEKPLLKLIELKAECFPGILAQLSQVFARCAPEMDWLER